MARASGVHLTRLMVDLNRVALRVARAEYADAGSLCAEVLADAEELSEKRIIAEAFKHQGVIARETRDYIEAERLLTLAFDQAMEREDLLLAAESAREQAELYLALGRNRDTLKALSLSHRLFSQLHARRDLADVSRRLRLLEQRFEHLVGSYAQNIESKDAYTLGHCRRVADLACSIATDYGFDQPTMFWFRVGALLHDVGKVVVPSDILNKAGSLSPEERAIMERHPVAGVELLHDVEFPWDVIPMIRGHHERWDGHGYPDGLAGEDIPLPARILCVADVFDALTSQRPYRHAFAARDAIQLMQADSGRHFDPEILTRFLRIINEQNEARLAETSRALFA
jgi:putative nucleotidyltransferase with HDIG domain